MTDIPESSHRRWWALATVALGTAVIIMDATIVNVALPVIIRDLSLQAAQAEWLNAAYALVFAAVLLPMGRLGDLRGRRRLLGLGTVLFLASSVLAASAQSSTSLIGARLGQGVGAAMTLTCGLATMNAMFQGRARAVAFAVYGSTIGGMAAIGPLVGGWLATELSWRWAFWINLPIGALVLTGIVLVLPETRDPTADHRLDVPAALLTAIAMGGLVFALIESPGLGWWTSPYGGLSPIPVIALTALAAGVALVRREVGAGRRGTTAMIDIRLFYLPTMRYGLIAAGIVAFGEFGLMFTMPLLLQGALGYTPLGAGWLLASLAVGAFLVSGLTPMLAHELGQRAVVRIGLALETLAVAGLAGSLSLEIETWTIAGWLFTYGLGVGMATALLSSIILSDVPRASGGQASGVQGTVRQLGSALGVAVLGTLLITGLGTGLQDRAVPSDAATVISRSAGAAIPAMASEPTMQPHLESARAALAEAGRGATGWAAVALGVGLLATFALPAGDVGRARARPRSPGPKARQGSAGPAPPGR